MKIARDTAIALAVSIAATAAICCVIAAFGYNPVYILTNVIYL